MIMRDRVRVWLHEDTGETDDYGNPVEAWVDHGLVPAAVEPLTSDAHYEKGYALSRYRMILAAQVTIPPTVGTDLRMEWRQFSGRPDGAGGLNVDGVVEEHTLGGRLHHYEAITTAVTT